MQQSCTRTKLEDTNQKKIIHVQGIVKPLRVKHLMALQGEIVYDTCEY